MMTSQGPVAELEPQYSSPDAVATPWLEAVAYLQAAEVFWLTTVRPDGRPHVTPLLSVWLEGGLYFCTGPDERKARNLASSPHCVMTTGTNALGGGLDLVIEGDAVVVRDEERLQRVADWFALKYGEQWRFQVRGGAFVGAGGGAAVVYELVPTTAFGFRKGDFSQTRWRFGPRT